MCPISLLTMPILVTQWTQSPILTSTLHPFALLQAVWVHLNAADGDGNVLDGSSPTNGCSLLPLASAHLLLTEHHLADASLAGYASKTCCHRGFFWPGGALFICLLFFLFYFYHLEFCSCSHSLLKAFKQNPLSWPDPNSSCFPSSQTNKQRQSSSQLSRMGSQGSFFAWKAFHAWLYKAKMFQEEKSPWWICPRPFFLPYLWILINCSWCSLDTHSQSIYSSSAACIQHIASERGLPQTAINKSIQDQASCHSLLNHTLYPEEQ